MLKGVWPILGVLVVLAASAGFSDSILDQLSLWMIESLLALSLVLVWGRAGIFSLGQSALYGIGAYAFGVVAVNLSGSLFLPWALLSAAVIAGLVAATLGYFIFYGRVSELSVAIITLAFTMVSYTILNSLSAPRYAIGSAKLGGYNGMIGIPQFQLGGPGSTPFTTQQVFITVGILVVVLTTAVALLLRSPFGRVISAIRSNDIRTELLGLDVRRYRLLTFILGGLLAGFAGGLYAAWSSYVSPGLFTLKPAVLVIIWVLVGGRSYVLGAIVGTLIIEALTSFLGGSSGQYSPIYLGIVLIVVVLFAPDGLFGALRSMMKWLRRLRTPASDSVSPETGTTGIPGSSASLTQVGQAPNEGGGGNIDQTLKVSGLRKTFGGFTAVDGVDLSFSPRSIHCIIGPNGAGKSTLFAMLMGTYRPTDGEIMLGDRWLNRVAPFRRARLGIGIKLQTASIFDELTTRENLWVAGYSLHHRRKEADSEATDLLETFGLTEHADAPASTLSHGQQQWLEIAMVTARKPSVILLDEPTAGMSVDETASTVSLIKALAASASVVVIEHDMEFVGQLEVPITVLHLGRQLMKGTLAELQASGEVRSVYLGGEARAQT